MQFDRFVVLAGGGPMGDERIVSRNTVVMRTLLGYSGATVPADDVSVSLAGAPIRFAAQTQLLEASFKDSTRETLGETTRVFCALPQLTSGFPPQRLRPGVGRRYRDQVRPCLVDRNNDGRFEGALLLGTRWSSDWLVVPIEPVAYAPPVDIPLPASELTVTFLYHSPVQGWVLQLGGRFLARPFNLIGIKLRPPGGTQRQYDGLTGVGASTYPRLIEYGAARISILGYDDHAHEVRLRIDHPFETAQVEFNFQANMPFMMIYH
jgi:hypothetical protein